MLLSFVSVQVWETHTMPPTPIQDNIFLQQDLILVNIKTSIREGKKEGRCVWLLIGKWREKN